MITLMIKYLPPTHSLYITWPVRLGSLRVRRQVGGEQRREIHGIKTRALHRMAMAEAW